MAALPEKVEDPVTALRRAVYSHGFQPVAVRTRMKNPIDKGWPDKIGVPHFMSIAANTGINCRPLRVIDIDIDDADAAGMAFAIAMESLGATVLVRKRATSPRRLLVYRGYGKKKFVKLPFTNLDGKQAQIEILGDGQQFVAFGIHPDGSEFEWDDDGRPDCVALTDLPEVTEEGIARLRHQLAEALGGEVVEDEEPEPVEARPSNVIVAPIQHRNPPDARITAYVSAAMRDEPAKVATCASGGRNHQLNISAMKLGQIVAAGWVSEREVVAALETAAVACGLVKDDGWPRARATIRSGLTKGKTEPRKLEDLGEPEVPAIVVEVSALMTAGKPKPTPTPAADATALPIDLGAGVDWTHPVGLLAEIADWILETSPMPNRPLAVAAATAVISTVCGRHLYAPSGTSLVVYVAMLAKTGVGKDRPLHAPAEILHASGLGALSKSGKTFAVSGLENMIVDSPCCLATTDELGVNLLARISHKRASTHEQAIKGTFLELWSRVYGKAPFLTTQRAGANSVSVHSPSYTLFGASTPDQFYKALEGGDVANGFMNRFLIAEAAPVAEEDEDVDLTPVPQVIIDSLAGIVPEPDGNLGGPLGVFTALSKVEERKMEWAADGVREAVRAFKKQIRAIVAEAPMGELWSRTYEYAIRLGAIHAVSRAGAGARVGMADMAWGAAWAVASARTMADAAENLMSKSNYEADLNDVKKAIRTAGTITRSNLLRTIRHLEARSIENITNHLAEAGIIEKLETKPEGLGRPTRLYRWKG